MKWTLLSGPGYSLHISQLVSTHSSVLVHTLLYRACIARVCIILASKCDAEHRIDKGLSFSTGAPKHRVYPRSETGEIPDLHYHTASLATCNGRKFPFDRGEDRRYTNLIRAGIANFPPTFLRFHFLFPAKFCRNQTSHLAADLSESSLIKSRRIKHRARTFHLIGIPRLKTASPRFLSAA